MDTTKNIERGARLGEFLDRKMLSKRDFSAQIGISASMISFYVSGNQPFTGRLIEGITEFYPELNLDWLFHGRGDMIKLNYSETLEVFQTLFNKNLSILIKAFEPDENNLSSLILSESTTLNDLKNNVRGPSLRLLIRLRERWGISIDDMLFTDLTHPGAMDNLKEKAGENLQIMQALENIHLLMEKVNDLEKRDQEKGKLIDDLKNTIQKDDDHHKSTK